MTKLKYLYLVKMTPLNTYFFGGEKTFTTPNGETNYFAQSNQWPQQTTVLGMLRYLIGRNVSPEFDPAKIGKHSFIADSSVNKFGIIEKLSPVFIVDAKGNYFLEAGIDHQLNKKTRIPERFILKPNPDKAEPTNFGVYGSGYCGATNAPDLTFDYKENMVSVLRNINDPGSNLIDPGELFHEQTQVGNKKNYEGGADDEAFFKQVFFRLEKKYAFAVILETNEELPFKFEIDPIDNKPFSIEIETMGADQSLFRIEAKILDEEKPTVFEDIETCNNSVTGDARIVLLSDAYVESVVEKCEFSICGTTDFRNIVTHATKNDKGEKTENYHQISLKEKNPSNNAYKNNIKFNLLRRGSVLFTDDAQNLLPQLSNPIFKAIGYNYYQITK